MSRARWTNLKRSHIKTLEVCVPAVDTVTQARLGQLASVLTQPRAARSAPANQDCANPIEDALKSQLSLSSGLKARLS